MRNLQASKTINMNVDSLPIRYPLDPKAKDYFYQTISSLKNILGQTVAKQMNMQLPEKSVSEICQIFFYVAINIENALDPRYKFGVDLVKKNFSKQVAAFQDDLTNIAQNAINKGVPKDFILEYLCFYYEDTQKKLFPTHPIILG